MKSYGLFTLFYVVFASWQTAIAQDNRYGFYFTDHRTRVCIPFLFRSNLIIVPVCINERDVVHFIVDTGVSHTIITDARAFQHRSLTISRTIKMAGMGEGNTLLASIAVGNSLTLGTLRINHHALVVLSEDVLNLSEYAGMPIHGIIGYELFADLVVTIDFQRQEITFIQPDHYRYRPGKGERVPIDIQDKKVYTDALTVSSGRQSLPLRVILDTGAGQALLLDRFQQLSAPMPVPEKVVRLSLGRGLTGMIHGEVGRLSTICIGRYVLNDVLVAYPDSTDFSLKLTQQPDRQGSIGCELLRRFRVTFNYPAGYVVLKPVKHVMREPFERDMSGMELRARGDDFGRYFIAQLTHNSPAERAGLQVGDELVVINGSAANTLPIGEIYQMLVAGEGRAISVIIRRHSQLLTRQFSLKRLI